MDAVESMAYNKAEKPWHGKGNPVEDEVTVDGMLVKAGLDWPVELRPVQFRFTDEDGTRRQVTDQKHNVLFRGDTGQVFDVVGSRYTPFQNEQVMEFFREYVEAGEMRLETAGSLRGGEYVWALAKMDQSFSVKVPDDEVEGYVLLANSHKYGKSAIAKFTGVRTVCWNTLTAALGDGRGHVRLNHTREFDEELRDDAKRQMGIAREQLEAYQRDAELLADLQLDDEQAIRIAAEVMRGDIEVLEYDAQNPRTKRVLDLYGLSGEVAQGYGSQLESAKGTGWGLLNSVTQYIDHEYGRNQDNRLTYSWIGGGERVKRKALTELLKLTA